MGEDVRQLLGVLAEDFEAFPSPSVADAGTAAAESAGSDRTDTGTDGPLAWSGYDRQRSEARRKTGHDESVLCGQSRIGGRPVVLVAFDFGFLGGSIGQESGSRIVAAFERARELRLPVVSVVASGGSRLQEGIRALSQLQRIARACTRTQRAGLAHISVLRDPTTGGMWASLAAGADVVLGIAGADVAFGGSRVRDPGQQGVPFTSEGKRDTGQVDLVVTDLELPRVLAGFVELLHPERSSGICQPAPVPESLGRQEPPAEGWEAVRWARSAERPRAARYLDHYFTTRWPIQGDRAGGSDAGMLCGIGDRHGRTVVYAGQTGTANTPAGFRVAARAVRLADRLGLPVLTLVDTPGAANDADAENGAVGPAIADVFAAVAEAEVPITTLVIGEGGSGGALALASPERTWITADAYFAVIAPEAAASILKRDPERVPELAETMRLRPPDLLNLGFVRGIVPPTPSTSD